VAELVDAQR